jgi:hypothetical protein
MKLGSSEMSEVKTNLPHRGVPSTLTFQATIVKPVVVLGVLLALTLGGLVFEMKGKGGANTIMYLVFCMTAVGAVFMVLQTCRDDDDDDDGRRSRRRFGSSRSSARTKDTNGSIAGNATPKSSFFTGQWMMRLLFGAVLIDAFTRVGSWHLHLQKMGTSVGTKKLTRFKPGISYGAVAHSAARVETHQKSGGGDAYERRVAAAPTDEGTFGIEVETVGFGRNLPLGVGVLGDWEEHSVHELMLQEADPVRDAINGAAFSKRLCRKNPYDGHRPVADELNCTWGFEFKTPVYEFYDPQGKRTVQH